MVILVCVPACSHVDTRKHHTCAYSRVLTWSYTCDQLKLLLQATHIFDGLESWPSHLMYLAGGTMHLFKPANEIPELQEGRLLQLVERYVSPVNMSCTRQLMHILTCSVYLCFCEAFGLPF